MSIDLSHFPTAKHPLGEYLEGQSVVLEPINVERHSQSLFEANQLDRSQKDWAYLPYGPFEDLDSYQAWLRDYEGARDPVLFAIVHKESGKAVGVASYLRIQPEIGSIEVGHIHFSRALQNTTGATEAMFLMMRWAFENGYRRYEWKCNSLNIRSRKAAQRLGFSHEGLFRQAAIVKGENRDTTWFSVIDKEWLALKECFERFLSEDNFDASGRSKTSLSNSTRPLLKKLDDFADLGASESNRADSFEEDEKWMRRALELAQGAGAEGEVPVGAVLVRDGTVLGEASNSPISSLDPSAHAEIQALRSACEKEKNYRLPGATLYVTIEPCTMCVGAMIHARIDRLVFGAREPKSGAVVSQNRLLEHPAMNSKIVYSEGVLQQDCSDLMSAFFAERRRHQKLLKQNSSKSKD